MLRWLIRCSTVAVVAVACGNSKSDDDDGAKGGPASSATCSEYVRALCDWQLRCDTTKTLTLDACLTQNANTCAFFALPGVTVTGSDFAACITRYAGDACTFPVYPPALLLDNGPCGFPAGTATKNCAFDLQCTTHLCSTTNGACGSCAYVPKQDLGGQCSQSIDCKDPADCVASVCTAQPKLGESCGDEQICVSRSGDAYVGCVGGVCTAGGRPNEPCLEINGAGYCGAGHACSPLGTCVPAQFVGPGEHCGSFADRIAFCRGGNCNFPDDPEKSECVSWPGIGESCQKVTNYDHCADGMYCDSTTATCALLPQPAPPDSCAY